MSANIIITLAVVVPLAIIAVVLLCGKGGFMVAGYNTMSKEKKATYDKTSMFRFVGGLLLVFVALYVLGSVGVELEMAWLAAIGYVAAVSVLIGGVIYANTKKRFRKENRRF